MKKKITLGTILRRLTMLLPNTPFINYLIVLPRFMKVNKRLPRNVNAANATFNDFILHRMIRKRWTVLQQACSDKEYSKTIAAGFSRELRAPATVDVIAVDGNTSAEDIIARLKPYYGKPYVAKPTHNCGGTLFLKDPVTDAALQALIEQAGKNYFYFARECQYRDLERKIIIEEDVYPHATRIDYKFHCAYGNVLYCQVDVDRFGSHRRAFYTVPEFAQVDVRYGIERPDGVKRPARFEEMIESASRLSRGFDYVRVDLYSSGDEIFFGEFTFTPGAGCVNIADERFSINFLSQIRSAQPKGYGVDMDYADVLQWLQDAGVSAAASLSLKAKG